LHTDPDFVFPEHAASEIQIIGERYPDAQMKLVGREAPEAV
jgi:hypothetical protein